MTTPTILIATPTRGRSMDIEYCVGMMTSASKHHAAWMPMGGQSDIYVARNSLINNFWHKKEHTTLIFIDSDIGFTQENFRDLIETPYPFVGGLYCDKGDNKKPVVVADGIETVADLPDATIPVKYLPMGFTKIHRSVLEALVDQKLVPAYGPEDQRQYQFFNGAIENDYLLSEDFSFCYLARQAGITPMANCKIRVKHDGRSL